MTFSQLRSFLEIYYDVNYISFRIGMFPSTTANVCQDLNDDNVQLLVQGKDSSGTTVFNIVTAFKGKFQDDITDSKIGNIDVTSQDLNTYSNLIQQGNNTLINKAGLINFPQWFTQIAAQIYQAILNLLKSLLSNPIILLIIVAYILYKKAEK